MEGRQAVQYPNPSYQSSMSWGRDVSVTGAATLSLSLMTWATRDLAQRTAVATAASKSSPAAMTTAKVDSELPSFRA